MNALAVSQDQLDHPDAQSWWTYEYGWLPTQLLRVEKFENGQKGTGFQRRLNLPFIKHGTHEFDPAMIEPLIVVPVVENDGSVWYSVIDGQHRYHILQRRNWMRFPA